MPQIYLFLKIFSHLTETINTEEHTPTAFNNGTLFLIRRSAHLIMV